MRGRALATILAVLAPLPMGAEAQDSIPGLVGQFTVTGQCLRVSMARENLTKGCTGEMAISVYSDRRTGFHLLMANGHIISVSGIHPQQGSGDVVDIDRIILNEGLESNKPQVFSAKGRCSYGNPFAGKMTVRCSGTLGKETDFTIAFETDGKPPVE